MNPNDQMLFGYAIFLIAGIALAIVVPYLRGWSDLVSSGNAFLLGGAIFVGLSCVECASREVHMQNYTSNMYMLFMVSAAWFFVVYVWAYHWLKTPRRLGGRMFQKWPEPTWLVTLTVIALIGLMATMRFTMFIPGVTQVLQQLTEKSAPFVVVIAFTAWYRDKSNPIMAAVVIGALGAAMLVSVLMGGSRRTFLGVLLAIPVCFYWYTGRNRSRYSNVALAGGVSFGLLFVLAAFAATRWFDAGHGGEERNVGTSIQQLSNTWSNLATVDLPKELGSLGQNATEVSLYCIYRTRSNDPAPFESIYIAASNPIPRNFWPDKPVVLGSRLVEEVIGVAKVNWGPGIVGHAYHEGGLVGGIPMLTFYAVLFAALLSWFDGLLASQPNNPFLVGILTAATPHLIAGPRGDLSVVFIQLAGALVLLILVQWLVVPIFGAARRPRPTYATWAPPQQARTAPLRSR